jgi:hypothetical protein
MSRKSRVMCLHAARVDRTYAAAQNNESALRQQMRRDDLNKRLLRRILPWWA